jgi:hypothetical protein
LARLDLRETWARLEDPRLRTGAHDVVRAFRERFFALADALVAEPGLEVEQLYFPSKGTDPGYMDELEAELGRPLPPSLRQLYGEVREVTLGWRTLENEAPNHHKPDPELDPDPYGTGTTFHHGLQLRLLPLSWLFNEDEHLESEVPLDGQPGVRFFCMLTDSDTQRYGEVDPGEVERGFLLIVEPERARASVVRGDDYRAAALEGAPLHSASFPEFLDQLLLRHTPRHDHDYDTLREATLACSYQGLDFLLLSPAEVLAPQAR